MEAFETVISEILWRDGYWVQPRLKVDLTREDKVAIGRPTSPRWEIDVVGYRGRSNELLLVECKSYLDWTGVTYRAVFGTDPKFSGRFKLFNDEQLRQVVVARLCQQLRESGLVSESPQVKIALACGKIASEPDRHRIQDHFADMGWLLWDGHWLKEKLRDMSAGSYENSPVAMVAKLLLRD